MLLAQRNLAAWALCGLALGLSVAASAAPLSVAELPPAARDWLPWAMQGQPPLGCPQAFDGSAPAACVWPGRLQLQATAGGASFRFELQVFGAPARVGLPGEAGAWPQGVTAGGKTLAVTEAGGQPAVWLPPGAHVVEGRWAWARMPQNLRVPADVASIVVTSDGATQARQPDADGRIWLRAVASPAEASDALTVQTVRHIDDDQPLVVTTAFELRVAGRARAVELPLALLPGLVAQSLDSPLPARLTEGGSLIVQARPGSWHLQLEGRLMTPVQALKLPAGGASPEEVWVVQAQPALRLVRPEGPASIDPRQTEMHESWRQLPAFRMKPGDTLKLTELQRGNAQAAPDALSLKREMWLDFDGGAWTARDRFGGAFKRSSRIDLAAPGELGRAALGGEDQPITRLAAQGPAGLEVRGGTAQVEADSRWPAGGELPASGWALGVDSLSLALHLPPGWMLLHAQGPDQSPQAWSSRWTLWDFFFVLLAALAAGRLAGWRLGALVGAALALTWHTAGSPPAWLWFALLASLGIARVMPSGRGAQALARLEWLWAGLLALWMLPFAVQQVRETLYPVLEAVPMAVSTEPPMPAAAPAVPERARVLMSKSVPQLASPPPAFIPPQQAPERLDAIDPGSRVQTGPGLPTWQWRQAQLSWSGPVTPEQGLRLWLLPPWAHAIFRLGGLALLLLALAALMRPRWPRNKGSGLASLAALVLSLGLAAAPQESQAAAPAKPDANAEAPWPSEGQQQALRDKLAAPPDCLPRCAELARLIVSAAGSSVQLRAEVHAQALTALPLPGQGSHWLPATITLDGQPAAARRDAEGKLWLAVPAGVHQVVLAGEAGGAPSLDIALPLPPREIQAELKGWTLSGLDPRGQSTGALSLAREAGTSEAKDADAGTQRDALPPLVRVARTLRLGLRWEVSTEIERLAPSRAPLRVRWALLPGEAVSDARVSVEGGIASLQLGADEAVEVASELKPADTLTLKAGKEPNQVEQWTLAASTRWHVDTQGLAPTALQQDDQWLPQWRPWPGESLKLAVRKPAGVAGQTLTLDGADTTVRPGERSTEYQLELKLRASLGAQQALRLPAAAELLEVRVGGQVLPLQLREGVLTLPITPGEQAVQLRWREPEGMGLWWRHPGVELGLPGVNDALRLEVPRSRIVLAVGGPLMGPAVLLWGVLAVVLALAWWLPRWLPAPLPRSSWLLLALGVAPVSLAGIAVVAAWFAALEARRRWAGAASRGLRMAVQVGLVLLSLAAVTALLDVLRAGLLGVPDLLVTGHGSSAWLLNWYADRFDTHTATAWVLSVPVWAYRVAMLLWALWLASSLLKWLVWGWQAFSAGGVWPEREPAAAVPVVPKEE